MPFKSLSHAKALLALSLIIGLSSAHFGKAWHDKARALSSSLAKTSSEVTKTKGAVDSLQEQLKPDSSPTTLDKALSALMLDVFNNRVEHGITIATATPGKQGGGGMTQLSALTEDVPGSALKSVKVVVTGTYQTYPALVAYLRSLQRQPAALVHLRVQEQSFETALRVYGTLDKQ